MEKKLLFLSIILLTIICINSTAVQDETVVLQGILQKGVFYGPINFGKDPSNDKPQDSYYLQLPNTLKQQLEYWDKHEIVDREFKWLDYYFIELAGPYQVNNDMAGMVGKNVRVTGQIFERYSRMHHTPLLLQVKKIEVVNEFLWQE